MVCSGSIFQWQQPLMLHAGLLLVPTGFRIDAYIKVFRKPMIVIRKYKKFANHR